MRSFYGNVILFQLKKKTTTHCECQKEAFSAVNYYKPITKYEFLVPNTKSFKSLDLFHLFFSLITDGFSFILNNFHQ